VFPRFTRAEYMPSRCRGTKVRVPPNSRKRMNISTRGADLPQVWPAARKRKQQDQDRKSRNSGTAAFASNSVLRPIIYRHSYPLT